MGTGDYICVTMSGGTPWGFRLQGGKGYQEPLHVCKVRSMSKASNAGLCVGDEVISINGTNCTDIPYSEVVTLIEKSIDSLQMLVKRTSSKTLAVENKNADGNINKEEYTESTTLQIRTGPESVSREHGISETNCPSFYLRTEHGTGVMEAEKDKEVILCHKITPKVIETPKGNTTIDIPVTKSTEEGRQGAMVELQLSLSQDMRLRTGSVPTVTLLGAETSSEDEHRVQKSETCLTTNETPMQKASTTFQITGKQQAKIVPIREKAQDTTFPRVELILECSGREKESRSVPAEGCVVSVEEGGHLEEPPSTVSFGITGEDSEQGEEDQQDHIRPNKHRARHARLRRSESLSEKQVKEAKSKCKSIALLLTAAPNPNSKGVLMFKKRRQRARKYTLTSYGTGELERYTGEEEDDNEEDENKENTFEVTFYGASESDVDEDFLSDPENSAHIVTFDWDTGLVEVERKLNTTEAMEELPETKGKGVLMFAKRKQRMDQITAEQEEMRKHSMEEKVSITQNVNSTISYEAHQQQQQQQTIKAQSCVSKSYIEVSNSQQRVQNGTVGTNESNISFQSSINRTARPFGGAQNQTALPFSPNRNIASPMSDIPAPPPYSSVTPPPEPRFHVSSPVSGKAQAAVWAPSYSTEQIASRDERIAVPASKTGILMEAKRRSTKPMFTFKDQPKVSPNPELLTLLQNREGKRATGNESGPEEDYLSLGAEACNFMQAHSGKLKTPPPVAPKPSVKSPTTVTPTSPVWIPPSAAAAQQPFVVQNSFQSQAPAEAPVAQSNFHYNPPNTLNLTAPPRGPPKVSTSLSQISKPKTPPTTPSGSVGPAYEMPALKGKGAELFARRQSRMEKFVVDSTTVQEKAARPLSPTPSLPCSWKYSSNVRAPPPLAYNPIQSPLYPPAANKPGSKTGTSAAKKKPTKTLSPLEVMKHQPYQLNSSLFTFQPPSASTSDTEASKKTTKSNVPAPAKQAQVAKPVNAPYINAQPTPEYSQPVYNTQPSFQSSVFTPASDSYPSVAYAMQPRQESPVATLIAPPRPKFSAKKAGVPAQVWKPEVGEE
ncbi:synaptopodin-2 [Leptodactylus fuscus]|uniref:synaptopodin-2 isoform X1 n=2 Tax=Leptodactylus fuscus TaxID=238119 RepID=UPI003F4F0B9F